MDHWYEGTIGEDNEDRLGRCVIARVRTRRQRRPNEHGHEVSGRVACVVYCYRERISREASGCYSHVGAGLTVSMVFALEPCHIADWGLMPHMRVVT